MQKRNVNEVVANNSNYTPTPIVRITQVQYSTLANHILDCIADTDGQLLTIDWEDAHSYTRAKFIGYRERKAITTIDITMATYNTEGDEVANDFDTNTFKAHLDELAHCCLIC